MDAMISRRVALLALPSLLAGGCATTNDAVVAAARTQQIQLASDECDRGDGWRCADLVSLHLQSGDGDRAREYAEQTCELDPEACGSAGSHGSV